MPNIGQRSIFSLDVLKVKDVTSTFTNNMSLPVHRWYRFSAGFSANWVKKLINEHSEGKKINILDDVRMGKLTGLKEGSYYEGLKQLVNFIKNI